MKVDDKMPIDEQITHYINKELDADTSKALEELLAKDNNLVTEKDSSEKLINSLKNEKKLIFSNQEMRLGESRKKAILDALNDGKQKSKPPFSVFRNFKFTIISAAAAIILLLNPGLFQKEAVETAPAKTSAVRGWFSFPVTMPSGVYTFSAMDDVLTLTKFVASDDANDDYLKSSKIELGDRILKLNDQLFSNLSKQDYERKFLEYLNENEVVVFLQRNGLDMVPYKHSLVTEDFDLNP